MIEGFEKRLKAIYDRMVKKRGKWAGSYAATNVNEYFVSILFKNVIFVIYSTLP